ITVRIVSKDPQGKSDDETPILLTHFLRAEKKNLNLQEDLGLSEDQIGQLTEAIPGGAAMLDPTHFDPTSLARLDMDTLQAILPTLMQSLGGAGGAGGLAGLAGAAGGAAGLNPNQLAGGQGGQGQRGGQGGNRQGGAPPAAGFAGNGDSSSADPSNL